MRKNQITAENGFSILTLDDDPLITSALQAYFRRSGYQVDEENDPVAAIERVRQKHYDILLLDYLMTPLCGDQVVAEIRKFNTELFIILLTGHKSMAPPIKTIRALDIQGYYEKSERFDQLELLVESCVKAILQLHTISQQKQELQMLYDQLRASYVETIDGLRLMVDARDEYTRGHSDRVAKLAELTARAMGRDPNYCEQVRIAGLFHDIGKLGVSDGVLLKTATLTDEEYEVIKRHPAIGTKILSSMSFLRRITPIVRAHHERIDGCGYPDGLVGDDIPEEARIIALADAFDAMTSQRQYRQAKSVEEAVAQLEAGRGKQFDAEITDVFLRVLRSLPPNHELIREQ